MIYQPLKGHQIESLKSNPHCSTMVQNTIITLDAK